MSNDSISESRRYYQRNKILDKIRYGQNVSRYDIKKATGYSMTTVLNIIDEMIADNWVYEVECDESRVGRKPVWLRLNPDAGYFIGIEFNSREMHCVILNFTCDVIYRDENIIQQENNNAADILEMVYEHIETAMAHLKDKQILGIGIGVPGYSDKEKGIAISYPHLRHWDNIPVKQLLEDRFKVPCYMENNVSGMIYAYKYLVYGGKCEDMLFISIRTGVRVMPIINNVPVSASKGFPGEMGHIKVSTGSRMCSCGKYGCLNSEISDYAVINKIKEGIEIGHFQEIYDMVQGNTDEISMDHFIKSAKLRHADTLKLMDQIASYLGVVTSMLVNIFAPRKIVLFGNLARIGEPFLKLLMDRIQEKALAENYSDLQIVASEFGRELGAIGAAALVMQEEFDFVEEKI